MIYNFIIKILGEFNGFMSFIFLFKSCDIWLPTGTFNPFGNTVKNPPILGILKWTLHLSSIVSWKLKFIWIFFVSWRLQNIGINKIIIFRVGYLGKGFIGEFILGRNYLRVWHFLHFKNFSVFLEFIYWPNLEAWLV